MYNPDSEPDYLYTYIGEKWNSVRKEHGIGKATFYSYLGIGLDAIDAAIRIKFPRKPSECKAASEAFQNISRPRIQGCLGAIDGILIKIHAPNVKNNARYRSRKGFFGLNVQAVCDASKRIIHLSVKTPGRTNDARAWRQSELYRAMTDGRWPAGYFLVGDAAYGNTETMLSPFTSTQMNKAARLRGDSKREDAFNFYQSQMRIRIECAFGEIVGRWGVLWKPLRHKMERTTQIISCCFKLHNFCVDVREEEMSLETQRARLCNRGEQGNEVPVLRGKDWQSGLVNNVPIRGSKPSTTYSILRTKIADAIESQGLIRQIGRAHV